MSTVIRFILMGCASKLEWRVLFVHWANGALFLARVGLCCALATAAFEATVQIAEKPFHLHGEWVDEAFSQTLSDKLGIEIRARDVRFAGWTRVRFGGLEVRDAQGQILVSSSGGMIHLKKMSYRKDEFIETEVILQDIQVTRQYYRRIKTLPIWARLLKKPVSISALKAAVRQNDRQTNLKILECDPGSVRIEGEMIFESSGLVQDRIKTSMSPWRFIASIA